ncbi:MAG TPA: DUF2784 domain-containing protein [Solimonas sp.]|nr:DUF2784 domain-containing protein [Solimonas sp.]
MSPAAPGAAADAVLVVHLAFILFVVLGALLVVWRPWIAALHLPALAWGLWVEAAHRTCPLMPLENALRERAGEAGYSGGFIEHYLVPLIYPSGLTHELQLGLGFGLAAWNLLLYGLALRRHLRRRARP